MLFFPSTLDFFILSRAVLYLVFSWFNITVLVLGLFSHGLCSSLAKRKDLIKL